MSALQKAKCALCTHYTPWRSCHLCFTTNMAFFEALWFTRPTLVDRLMECSNSFWSNTTSFQCTHTAQTDRQTYKHTCGHGYSHTWVACCHHGNGSLITRTTCTHTHTHTHTHTLISSIFRIPFFCAHAFMHVAACNKHVHYMYTCMYMYI